MPELEILSDVDLAIRHFEPLRSNKFVLNIDGIDSWSIKSAGRPNITVGETEHRFINDIRYLAGQYSLNTIPLVLHDVIDPSTAQKVFVWLNLCHEISTGREGYAALYKKDIILKMLDPNAVVIQKWELRGSFPTNIDFGGVDYTSVEMMNISMTLRYDKPVLLF
jgi:hypothetical protein